MKLQYHLALLAFLLPMAVGPAGAQGFSFSQQDAQDKAADKAETDARQYRIAVDLSTNDAPPGVGHDGHREITWRN